MLKYNTPYKRGKGMTDKQIVERLKKDLEDLHESPHDKWTTEEVIDLFQKILGEKDAPYK